MYKEKIVVILIISLLLLNIDCGQNTKQRKEDGKVTITFWHSFVASTIPALKDLIKEFEKEHPNINIKAQYVPSGDALIQKLITAIQSNTAPDISWIHSHFLPDLVDAKAIYNMEEFVNGKNGLSEQTYNNIYEPLIQYASLRDTLYSIPMEATNLAFLYNKKMFREVDLDDSKAPQNWGQLRKYAKLLTKDKDNNGEYDQMGLFLPIYPASGSLSGWMVWQWFPFLWQAGGHIVSKDQSHVLYNSTAGVKALNLWKDIYNELDLEKFTSDYDIAFASERLSMAMDGPWNLPRYNRLLKDLDWTFAPLPEGPEKKATIVGGEYLVIFKQSDYPDEAWSFIKWIIQPEVQAKWAMKSGYLPVRRDVEKVPEFKEYLKNNPNFKVFIDQMEFAQVQRKIDYHGLQITRHIAQAIEEATLGGEDPQVTLDRAAKKSNALLQSVPKNEK
ncbi:MAG: ABC transporter substrate-binding protein [Candidatus Marinimicrobia bacterium]|nr:ABC transporter substrate-binding protein [Candidatus Neomarinimicrobiota bacterium]